MSHACQSRLWHMTNSYLALLDNRIVLSSIDEVQLEFC